MSKDTLDPDQAPSSTVRGRRSLWRSFIRTFFHLLYHELAWTYDLVAWLVSFGQWKTWARAAIPRLRGPRVLDLAHGPGHLLVALHRVGLAPVGLDLSPQMGRLAQARLRRVSTPGLVRACAQAMPFRAGSFDSVVSTFPAEFIVDPATLKEIARVMKDEGCAVVVPGVAFKRNLPARFLEWLYTITGQQEPVPPGLTNALAEAGLAIEMEREPMGMVDVLVAVATKSTAGRDAAS
jgi:ubiquinone/menaquinone biosynthesis C-methylase UbiE